MFHFAAAKAESPACLRGGLGTFIVVSLMLTVGMAAGLPVGAGTSRTVVIRDDHGGSVKDRAAVIQTYRKRGTRVQIRGKFCYSSCTMFLGLETACVSPKTVFGFHGPSSRMYGMALPASVFDHWSGVMADHYPEPLRSWFLKTGRHRIVGFHEFSGSDLIRMGITRCPGSGSVRTG